LRCGCQTLTTGRAQADPCHAAGLMPAGLHLVEV
jgi:hypothetical protein